MKLYKPVLIESAEQAEALPVGTIATHGDHWPAERCTPHRWESAVRDMEHNEMVGWTALVPIEVDEEWAVGHESPYWAPGTEEWAREFQTHVPGRRLFRRSTTPWEEA